MKQIDIRELPTQFVDDVGDGKVLAVTRDGEVLGHFVPKYKEDPERKRRERETMRRKLAEYRADGSLDEQILDNLDRAYSEDGSSNGHVSVTPALVPGLRMGRIDARDLPRQSSDEIRTGPTYTVERNGEVMGIFVPRLKKDPEAIMKAWDALDRSIERYLRETGITRDQLEEDLDLSKPFRHDIRRAHRD